MKIHDYGLWYELYTDVGQSDYTPIYSKSYPQGLLQADLWRKNYFSILYDSKLLGMITPPKQKGLGITVHLAMTESHKIIFTKALPEITRIGRSGWVMFDLPTVDELREEDFHIVFNQDQSAL